MFDMDDTMDDQNEKPSPRIAVVDSVEMEREVYYFLKKFVLSNKFIPTMCLNLYEHEVDVLLKFLIWKFSVGVNNATFGQQFLHLKYSKRSSRKMLVTFGLLNAAVNYCKEKCSNIFSLINHSSSRQTVTRYIRLFETVLNIFNFYSFLSFIKNGGSPTFEENILRLTPVSTVNLSSRIISHSRMKQEYIWYCSIEIFLHLTPLINYFRWKRHLERLLNGRKKDITERVDVFMWKVEMECVSCHDPPILPCQMDCSHIICYYCISSNILADSEFDCPSCGYSNSSMEDVKLLNAKS